MIKQFIYITLFFLTFTACKNTEKPLTAQQIVDKAITVSGGLKYKDASVSFDFRDKSYVGERTKFGFTYQRNFLDKEGNKIKDIYTHKSFDRFINDTLERVADTMANKYGNAINSVFYFVQLPYGLNDKAVHKSLIGEVDIKNKTYYKIKVSFSEEGGGDDFDDVYYYWIHKTDFTVDYLAYKYHVNGGGIRFRSAYNQRVTNGIRFVDYLNYKITPPTQDNFDQLEKLFEANKLELLSKIETENETVKF